MIDTTFFATSEKLWPGACSTFGGPRSSSAQKPRRMLDRGAALRRAQIAARGLAAFVLDRQRVARVVEAGAQRRQPLVLHQHQKAHLRLIARRRRVEAGRAVLDGIEPVARHGLADGELARASGSGESPFTG